ncbi:protein-L-isoaspartate O-methyltransferase [Luteimonas sp. 50]|uniref:Protein-L-isoaspartate O-methyltransferase n=1 Tax=Cognatiluteimonas sedimenti TaxID=2927791 RepID=A0ABT0A3N4_9GAMM|nr:protein-L-isoaspartate O-methyltransferase [Lysobacter sedimenti]MCJ0825596.1 protein-L-isoaspartate O-methyltransferase [Lysobacter sedimenti]
MTTIDYARARETMVEQQVRPWDVLDPRVLDTLARLPREAFVPEAYRALAYADLQLPIGHGEVMLKPVVEGRTLQALALQPTDAVLEIGTGSGWFTACLGRLAREVVSLELHADLAEAAHARLAAQGLDGNVRIEVVDALHHESTRRYDAICVTGAVDVVPARFLQWLRPGGRLFVVSGRTPAMVAQLLHADAADGGVVRVQSLFETDIPYLAGAAPVPQFQW